MRSATGRNVLQWRIMIFLTFEEMSDRNFLLNNEGSSEIVNGKTTHEVGWLADGYGVYSNALVGIEVIDHGPFIWVAYKSV